MRYVISRWKREQHEVAYRIYVTDSLKAMTENTAAVGGGKAMQSRYFDLVNDKHVAETRSKDDIIKSLKGKLKALGGE